MSVYPSSPMSRTGRYSYESSSPPSSSPPSTSPFRQQEYPWQQQPRIYLDSSPRMGSGRKRVDSIPTDYTVRSQEKERGEDQTRLQLPSFRSLLGPKDVFELPPLHSPRTVSPDGSLEMHSDYCRYSEPRYSLSPRRELNLPPMLRSRHDSVGSSDTMDSPTYGSWSPSVSPSIERFEYHVRLSDEGHDEWGHSVGNDDRYQYKHPHRSHQYYRSHYTQRSLTHHDELPYESSTVPHSHLDRGGSPKTNFFSPSKCSPYPRRTFFQESSERGRWQDDDEIDYSPIPKRFSALQKCSKAVQASEVLSSYPQTGHHSTSQLSVGTSTSPLPPSSPRWEMSVSSPSRDRHTLPTLAVGARAHRGKELSPTNELPGEVGDEIDVRNSKGKVNRVVMPIHASSDPSTSLSHRKALMDRCDGAQSHNSGSVGPVLERSSQPPTDLFVVEDHAKSCGTNARQSSAEWTQQSDSIHEVASNSGKYKTTSDIADEAGGSNTPAAYRDLDKRSAGSELHTPEPTRLSVGALTVDKSHAEVEISPTEGVFKNQTLRSVSPVSSTFTPDTSGISMAPYDPENPFVAKAFADEAAANLFKDDIVVDVVPRSPQKGKVPRMVPYVLLSSPSRRVKCLDSSPSSGKQLSTKCVIDSEEHLTPSVKPGKGGAVATTTPFVASTTVTSVSPATSTGVAVRKRPISRLTSKPATSVPHNHQDFGLTNTSTSIDAVPASSTPPRVTVTIEKVPMKPISHSIRPATAGTGSKDTSNSSGPGRGAVGAKPAMAMKSKGVLKSRTSEVVNSLNMKKRASAGDRDTEKRSADDAEGPVNKKARISNNVDISAVPSIAVLERGKEVEIDSSTGKVSKPANLRSSNRSIETEEEENADVEIGASAKSKPLFYPSFSRSPSLPPFETSLAITKSFASSRRANTPLSSVSGQFEMSLADAITGVAASATIIDDDGRGTYPTPVSSPPNSAASSPSTLSSILSSVPSTPSSCRSKKSSFEMNLADLISGMGGSGGENLDEGVQVPVVIRPKPRSQVMEKGVGRESNKKDLEVKKNVKVTLAKSRPEQINDSESERESSSSSLPVKRKAKAVSVSQKKRQRREVAPAIQKQGLAPQGQRKGDMRLKTDVRKRKQSVVSVVGRTIVSDDESSDDEEDKEEEHPIRASRATKSKGEVESRSKAGSRSTSILKTRPRRRGAVSDSDSERSDANTESDSDSDSSSPPRTKSNTKSKARSKSKTRARSPAKKNSSSSKTRPSNHTLPPLAPLDTAVTGLLIETMAQSRASSHLARTLYNAIMENKSRRVELDGLFKKYSKEIQRRVPAELLAGEHDGGRRRKGGSVSEEGIDGMSDTEVLWASEFERVMEEGAKRCGIFGKVESSAKDDADLPIPFSSRYFYVPDCDPDGDRASLILSIMPRAGKRSVTKTYKQYYWKPLGKVSRWEPEDEL